MLFDPRVDAIVPVPSPSRPAPAWDRGGPDAPDLAAAIVSSVAYAGAAFHAESSCLVALPLDRDVVARVSELLAFAASSCGLFLPTEILLRVVLAPRSLGGFARRARRGKFWICVASHSTTIDALPPLVLHEAQHIADLMNGMSRPGAARGAGRSVRGVGLGAMGGAMTVWGAGVVPRLAGCSSPRGSLLSSPREQPAFCSSVVRARFLAGR